MQADQPREHQAHLATVLANRGDVVLVALALLLLLYAGDDAPRGTTSSDHILVGDREQVSLLNRQLGGTSQGGDLLHLFDHLIISLSLLGLWEGDKMVKIIKRVQASS